MTGNAIDGWLAFMESRDPTALDALLADDVVFESPVVFSPQRGKAITAKYLLAAEQVLGTPDFRYTGRWSNDTGGVLEFETVIDGVAVNGVDIITLTDDGRRFIGFKVMVRPLKAIQAVHAAMGAMLAGAPNPA